MPAETANDEASRRRLHFDGTINAGHILTFFTLLAVGFGSWSTMDKRVTVLEENRMNQQKRDEAQDLAIGEKLGDIKEGLREVKRSVDQVKEQQIQQRLAAGR